MDQSYEAALRATASAVPGDAIEGFRCAEERLTDHGALASPLRAAHLIGQCAHESAGFTHRTEVLHYSSAARLRAIFPRHFRNDPATRRYLRNPRALANFVYAGRIGNGDTASGDGYRFRGRGWLQLTGRANYARMGRLTGLDLVARPDLAADPAIAWQIAAAFLATRRSGGRTALAWADLNNVERVTRIVNGGLNGLAQRRRLTALAATMLDEAEPHRLKRGATGNAVLMLQTRLAELGHAPGPLDGVFGPMTAQALMAFQAANGLLVSGEVGPIDRQVLS